MLMNTYNRFPITFVRGEGCNLYDEAGKEYLDFGSGIGVCSVGHSHPKWIEAVNTQARMLTHVSNYYNTLPASALAEKLAALSGLEAVFFANSGAEANEGMIKMARKYSHDKYGDGRATIVTLQRSFHGRTVTTLSATGQDAFHQHFFPFTEGFMHVPPGDIGALAALRDASVQGSGGICAVMVEAIQGEGGVYPFPPEYLQGLAELCAENDWLLLFDEVQTGIGRTGKWFAFQHADGVVPDGISFAKGIAGGLPLGGFIASKKCAGTLSPGNHAATFGGNCVCCAAGLTVLDILAEALPQVSVRGEQIMKGLSSIGGLSEVRGQGLMIGATITSDKFKTPRSLVFALLENGLACLSAGDDSLRVMPPLVISENEVDKGIEIIRRVLS